MSPAACIEALKRFVATGRGVPGLTREARRVLRVGGVEAAVVRTLMDAHAWIDERLHGKPEVTPLGYDDRKPVDLWTPAEIEAWQADYPEYRWDVWCVICGVHR